MVGFSEYFGPFDDVSWINSAHQGALPRRGVTAAQEAIEWKRSPHPLINSRLFSEVPCQQREVLGRLVNCAAEDVILGNSASYGLHLLANGIPWRNGDEVLVVDGDFPATVLPWMGLAERGVKIRQVAFQDGSLKPEALDAHISRRTRVFCSSWVFSFSGVRLDIPSIGEVCQARGVKVILNCSQGLGGIPFDVRQGQIDAITCTGFKWLCGPYGTGFCWIDPEFRDSLVYNQAYWLAMQTAEDLQGSLGQVTPRANLGARKYDVFGTANFFNLKPWTEAVKLLLEIGIDSIWEYDQALVQQLIDGLDQSSFEVLSPTDPVRRSNIVLVSHRSRTRNRVLFESLLRNKVFVALRNEQLRLAPHLFNTPDEIEKTLSILNGA